MYFNGSRLYPTGEYIHINLYSWGEKHLLSHITYPVHMQMKVQDTLEVIWLLWVGSKLRFQLCTSAFPWAKKKHVTGNQLYTGLHQINGTYYHGTHTTLLSLDCTWYLIWAITMIVQVKRFNKTQIWTVYVHVYPYEPKKT